MLHTLGPATRFSDSHNPTGWLLQENLAGAIPGGGGAKFPLNFTNAEVFDVPKSLLGSGDLGTWRKKKKKKIKISLSTPRWLWKGIQHFWQGGNQIFIGT